MPNRPPATTTDIVSEGWQAGLLLVRTLRDHLCAGRPDCHVKAAGAGAARGQARGLPLAASAIELATDHTITEAPTPGLFHLENHTVEYQFNDADFAARYTAIKENGGDDLSPEIALLRLLIELRRAYVPGLGWESPLGLGESAKRGVGSPPAGRRTARQRSTLQDRPGNLPRPCGATL